MNILKFGWVSFFAVFVFLIGCSSIPVKEATTVEGQAYASYGVFVVFEEQAAKLVANPSTPAEVKLAIKRADANAKPAVDSLLGAVREYLKVKGELTTGTTTNDKLQIATANLSKWLNEATPLINSLIQTIGNK